MSEVRALVVEVIFVMLACIVFVGGLCLTLHCAPYQMTPIREAAERINEGAQTVEQTATALAAWTHAAEVCFACAEAIERDPLPDGVLMHPCLVDCMAAAEQAAKTADALGESMADAGAK